MDFSLWPLTCVEGGAHSLPDAREYMDSTYRACRRCEMTFVVCSIMEQGTHSRHWIRSTLDSQQEN